MNSQQLIDNRMRVHLNLLSVLERKQIKKEKRKVDTIIFKLKAGESINLKELNNTKIKCEWQEDL